MTMTWNGDKTTIFGIHEIDPSTLAICFPKRVGASNEPVWWRGKTPRVTHHLRSCNTM